MPSNINNFLSIEEFGELFNLRQVNCAFTSFVRKHNLQHWREILYSCKNLDTTQEVGDSYLAKADELKKFNGYGREALKRILSIESFEASKADEFRLVFGHQKRTIERNVFGCRYNEEVYDFHVVVGVRDSTGKVRWYHKFGVSYELPRELTTEDWEEIWQTYTCNPPALFAFHN